MRKHTLSALALALCLSPVATWANDDTNAVAAAVPDTAVPDVELPPDIFPAATATPGQRMIGQLLWHTDYSTAYRAARVEQKMLFIFFRDAENPRLADTYEREVLSSDELHGRLEAVVRVVLPLDAKRPFHPPELPDLTLLAHSSFKYMYGRQGIAMIDLTDPESDLWGQVVSEHPFTQGKRYTVRGTKIILGLPTGTVTQRALIYAVRLHPAAPISTTEGKCDRYLCKAARQSSKLMATYESVGHHDWWMRYGEIASATGRSAMEVAAMSGNQSLVDAAIELVDQWYYSSAHWGIMSAPAAVFGYDLVRAPSGNWYGTGLFAN